MKDWTRVEDSSCTGSLHMHAKRMTYCFEINRGFYTRAHVLLKLLKDEFNKFNNTGAQTLDSINHIITRAHVLLKLLNDEFNKFNNAGAQTLDSINHITLELIKNSILNVKTSIFCVFHATL